MKFNEYQTQLTKELIESLDKELYADLIDTIDSILFVKNLISPDRKRATDLERDEEGKIIVDITNPHILEDMDYFRQAALHFEQFGVYTILHPNSNPNSEYSRFWREEARRCRQGYVREYDGEWIPGPYYFYLNYGPILKNVLRKNKGARVDRFQMLPEVYDGDYFFYHYVEQARNHGKHGNVLKRRGSGFSFKAAAGLARLFILGESEQTTSKVKGFAIADEKEYLIKDGILNKFEDQITWCADHTPWPRLRLKDSINDMNWVMGYQEKSTGLDKIKQMQD